MAKKINRNKNLIKANKVFTDREVPREVFHNEYNLMKHNIQLGTEVDPRIITYYGIGGIGKSTLLKQIQKELIEKEESPFYTYYDFEQSSNMISVLEGLRNRLVADYKISFPLFDVVLAVYKKKVGVQHFVDREENSFEENAIISSTLDIMTEIPVIGSAFGVVKPVTNVLTELRNKKKDRAVDVFDIESNMNQPDELLRMLPEQFGKDMADFTENLKTPFVIFLDTYEQLVNELSGGSDAKDKDLWIRDDDGLVLTIPNVLWVIAGREKIKWNEMDEDWKENLNQHLLGELSNADTNYFLYEAGITDVELSSDIYKVTKGVPVYLDIVVDNYFTAVQKGEKPTIKLIGNDYKKLMYRFLKYAGPDMRDLLYMVSTIDYWDDEHLFFLREMVLNNVAISTIAKLNEYSFISKEEGKFKMHQVIKEHVYNECPDILRKKTMEYHVTYLNKILEDFSSLNTKKEELITAMYRLISIMATMDCSGEEIYGFFKKNIGLRMEFVKFLLSDSEKRDIYEAIDRALVGIIKNDVDTKYMHYIKLVVMSELISSRNYQTYQFTDFVYRSYSTIRYELGRMIEDKVKVDPYIVMKSVHLSLKFCSYDKESPLASEFASKFMTIFGIAKLGDNFFYDDLALTVSKYFAVRGDVEKALDYSKQLLDAYEDRINADEKEKELLKRIKDRHYRNLRLLDEHKDNFDLINDNYQDKLQAFGPNHIDTLISHNNLMLYYLRKKEYEKAIDIADDNFKRAKEILGEKEYILYQIHNNLAYAYYISGDKKKSYELTFDCYNKMIKFHGMNNPLAEQLIIRMNILSKKLNIKNNSKFLLKNYYEIRCFNKYRKLTLLSKLNDAQRDYIMQLKDEKGQVEVEEYIETYIANLEKWYSKEKAWLWEARLIRANFYKLCNQEQNEKYCNEITKLIDECFCEKSYGDARRIKVLDSMKFSLYQFTFCSFLEAEKFYKDKIEKAKEVDSTRLISRFYCGFANHLWEKRSKVKYASYLNESEAFDMSISVLKEGILYFEDEISTFNHHYYNIKANYTKAIYYKAKPEDKLAIGRKYYNQVLKFHYDKCLNIGRLLYAIKIATDLYADAVDLVYKPGNEKVEVISAIIEEHIRILAVNNLYTLYNLLVNSYESDNQIENKERAIKVLEEALTFVDNEHSDRYRLKRIKEKINKIRSENRNC